MKRPCRPIPIAVLIALIAVLAASPSAKAAEPAQFSVTVSGSASGAPLVLIPGLSSPAAVWDGTVDALCRRGPYQCHVLHLAGFAGKAPVPAPSLDTVRDQLAAYIRAGKLKQPAVIGHSLGGFLALGLAAAEPQLVGRVVVVDALPALGAAQAPALTPTQLRAMAAQRKPLMLQQSDAQFAQYSEMSIRTMVTSPIHIEQIAAWGRQSDRATVVQTMTDLMGTDLREDVKRIQAPVLVLGSWIAYKEFAPRSAIEATFRDQYRHVPNLTLEMAEHARHFIMYDDPAWMLDKITRFLAQ